MADAYGRSRGLQFSRASRANRYLLPLRNPRAEPGRLDGAARFRRSDLLQQIAAHTARLERESLQGSTARVLVDGAERSALAKADHTRHAAPIAGLGKVAARIGGICCAGGRRRGMTSRASSASKSAAAAPSPPPITIRSGSI